MRGGLCIAVIEKECLAVVWALKLFHIYLYGQDFTIEIDHRLFVWLDRMKNSNARLTRWALQIQPYHLTMKHRSGTKNVNADGLSCPAVERVEDERKSKENSCPPSCKGEGM